MEQHYSWKGEKNGWRKIKDFGKRNWKEFVLAPLLSGIIVSSSPKDLSYTEMNIVPNPEKTTKSLSIEDSVKNSLKENEYLSEDLIRDEDLEEAIRGLKKWPEALDLPWKLVGAQMLHEAGWADAYTSDEPYKGWMEFTSSDSLPIAEEVYDERAERYLDHEELEDYKNLCGVKEGFSREKLNRDQECNVATASILLKSYQELFESWTGAGKEWGIDYKDVWDEPLVFDVNDSGEILYNINKTGLSEREREVLDNKLNMYSEWFNDPKARKFSEDEIKSYKREEKVPVSEIAKIYFLGNSGYVDRIGKIGTKEKVGNRIQEEYPFEVFKNMIDLDQEYSEK